MRDFIYAKENGLTRRAVNETDGSFVLATEQDLEDVIEENKRLRENQTKKEHYRLVARVPVHVAEQAMREGWFHDDKMWARWLNDIDNRDHRVWEGKV